MANRDENAALYPPAVAHGGRRRGVARSALRFGGGLLAGVILAQLATHLGVRWLEGFSPGETLVFLAALLLGLWPNIIVHELGHALAGMARGMRVVAAGIGPLRLERRTDGWSLRHGGAIQGLGGFAALVPAPGRSSRRLDMAAMLAGGPGINLLTAACCLGLAPADGGWPGAALLGIGTGACLLGVGNLLPLQAGGWRSDGRGLLDLVRDPETALAGLRMNQIAALSIAGTRPRDWPVDLLPQRPAATMPPLLAAGSHMLLMLRDTDSGRHAQAGAHARALATLHPDTPDGFRQHVAVLLAMHAAVGLRDLRLLAAWRRHCNGGLMDISAWRHWLDAELAAGDARPGEAQAQLAQARAALPRLQDRASARMLGEWLDALSARLGHASGAFVPAADQHGGDESPARSGHDV